MGCCGAEAGSGAPTVVVAIGRPPPRISEIASLPSITRCSGENIKKKKAWERPPSGWRVLAPPKGALGCKRVLSMRAGRGLQTISRQSPAQSALAASEQASFCRTRSPRRWPVSRRQQRQGPPDPQRRIGFRIARLHHRQCDDRSCGVPSLRGGKCKPYCLVRCFISSSHHLVRTAPESALLLLDCVRSTAEHHEISRNLNLNS